MVTSRNSRARRTWAVESWKSACAGSSLTCARCGGLCRRFVGSWNKRWFVIQPTSRELLYFKSKGASQPSGGIDLDSITDVKRFDNLQFQVESPSRNFFLRAENEASANEWVYALQNYVGSLSAFRNYQREQRESKTQELTRASKQTLANLHARAARAQQDYDAQGVARRRGSSQDTSGHARGSKQAEEASEEKKQHVETEAVPGAGAGAGAGADSPPRVGTRFSHAHARVQAPQASTESKQQQQQQQQQQRQQRQQRPQQQQQQQQQAQAQAQAQHTRRGGRVHKKKGHGDHPRPPQRQRRRSSGREGETKSAAGAGAAAVAKETKQTKKNTASRGFGKLTADFTPTKPVARRPAAHEEDEIVQLMVFSDDEEENKAPQQQQQQFSSRSGSRGGFVGAAMSTSSSSSRTTTTTTTTKRMSARDLIATSRRTDFAPLAFSDTEDDDEEVELWTAPSRGTASRASSGCISSSASAHASPTASATHASPVSTSPIVETTHVSSFSRPQRPSAAARRATTKASAGVTVDADFVDADWDEGSGSDSDNDEDDAVVNWPGSKEDDAEATSARASSWHQPTRRVASKADLDTAAGVTVDENFADEDWDDEEEEE